jgi:hypothetical protein
MTAINALSVRNRHEDLGSILNSAGHVLKLYAVRWSSFFHSLHTFSSCDGSSERKFGDRMHGATGESCTADN